MSSKRVNTIKPNQQDHKCPWGISEKFSVEQRRSLQGSNRTWSRDFGGAGAERISWSGDQSKHLSYCGRGAGAGRNLLEKSSWCSCPALPYFLPTVNRQTCVPSRSSPGSSKMPMYGDDFYGPGLSAIYLSPRRYFPCTHIPSRLFSTISPSSVFHHFSPPPVFPVWSYHWQYRNLWKEARHDTHFVELSPQPAVQEVRETGGTVKQAHQLAWRMTRGPEAFLYCRNVTKTLARHTHGCTMVETKETDWEKLWGGGRAEY